MEYEGMGLEQATAELENLDGMLAALKSSDKLEGRCALHGGAAINEFLFDLPRVSYDIDLSILGDIPASELRAHQAEVYGELQRLGRGQGYRIAAGKGSHAGRTFKLKDEDGEIAVKIDVNFMNRVPPCEPEARVSATTGETFPVLSPHDVMGGKIRAVLGRVKARDLYDVRTISEHVDEFDPDLLHGMLLLYATLSDSFPHYFSGSFADLVALKFCDPDDVDKDIKANVATTFTHDESIDGAELIEEARAFMREWVDPRNADEEAYVLDMVRGIFRPELILPDKVAERARRFPEAMWKVKNLERYQELPVDAYEDLEFVDLAPTEGELLVHSSFSGFKAKESDSER